MENIGSIDLYGNEETYIFQGQFLALLFMEYVGTIDHLWK